MAIAFDIPIHAHATPHKLQHPAQKSKTECLHRICYTCNCAWCKRPVTEMNPPSINIERAKVSLHSHVSRERQRERERERETDIYIYIYMCVYIYIYIYRVIHSYNIKQQSSEVTWRNLPILMSPASPSLAKVPPCRQLRTGLPRSALSHCPSCSRTRQACRLLLRPCMTCVHLCAWYSQGARQDDLPNLSNSLW